MNSESWRERASCRRMKTEDLYPPQYHREQVADVLEMCNNYCPVRDECRAYADSFEDTYKGTWGIWGGETEQERIARRARDKVKETCGSGSGRMRTVRVHWNRGEPLCTRCQLYMDRKEGLAPRTLDKGCATPGRKRSVARHRAFGQPLCGPCQKSEDRREADEARWEQARQLIARGMSNHEVTLKVGCHRDTVKRLREEMQADSISS